MAKHLLVVGGTGMLRDACMTLASREWIVGVLGRDPVRLEAMMMEASAAGGILYPLQVDYDETDALVEAIEDARRRFGAIDTVVAWVRSSSGEALDTILEVVSEQESPWKLFQLKGSAAAQPGASHRVPDLERAHGLCEYHDVVLGFQAGDAGSRWLTDEEICGGVVGAVETGKSRIVGTVEPWDARPGT